MSTAMPFGGAASSILIVAGLLTASGCTEVSGRRLLQQGNELYKEGRYKEAVAKFVEAEALVPQLPVLWLNKGYTCRQLLIPGSKTPENRQAADCALSSFKRMQELAPSDKRAFDLWVQTLFDAEEFEVLAKMFLERNRKSPNDMEPISSLQQVYAKWGKFDEALEWYKKAAEVKGDDPEKHYSVGVFIWQRLFLKGGGPDKQTFDPRPQPGKPRYVPPVFATDDVQGQQRVDLADMGIHFLEKAIQLRPKYTEAMAYVNLLHRQKSFSYFTQPELWQQSVDKATEWSNKTMEAMGKAPTAPASNGAAADKPANGAPAPKVARKAASKKH